MNSDGKIRQEMSWRILNYYPENLEALKETSVKTVSLLAKRILKCFVLVFKNFTDTITILQRRDYHETSVLFAIFKYASLTAKI
jgi:hypothetical protein